jgi:sigma-B regulation protein RsbU (phosphoserine phosphatase)
MINNLQKKILLVDDNLMFLKIMEKAFQKHGFHCYVSESAGNAIALLETKINPDIILSDYEMPEMNGIEFRRYLTGVPEFNDIPFVFLTSFSNHELIVTGLDLKAIDYVIKETPVDVIVSKINNILLTIEKQRELTGLEIKKAAASLNFKSIPLSAPCIDGFTIDFWHSAFHDIPGGDFIDFIRVNDRYSFIVLGDVMGKKWNAWFFTFGFLSYVRSAIRFAAFNEDYSTVDILNKVNSVICFDNILKDILSSLSLLLIDSETGALTYSGAGDLPLVHYQHAQRQVSTISSSGLLLGLFENGNFNEQNIILEPGDSLFIFSDGLIDFSDGTGKKSDFNDFSNLLLQKLSTGENFGQIKEGFLNNGLQEQVDDRSLIRIYKI